MKFEYFTCDICAATMNRLIGPHQPKDVMGYGLEVIKEPTHRIRLVTLGDSDIHLCKACLLSLKVSLQSQSL